MAAEASSSSTEEMVLTGRAEAKPRDFVFPLPHTALLVFKMQREFLDDGGYGSLLGNDAAKLRECVPAVKELLEAARAAGLGVIHVKESHLGDLSDVPATKARRLLKQTGGKITVGDEGALGRVLIDGEPGNDFFPGFEPKEGEVVIRTTGKGVMYGSSFLEHCTSHGITHIILAGVTIEIGVQLVMRELNDCGFEPCLVSDGTASYFNMFREVSLEMIVAQGGIVGWASTKEEIIKALDEAKPEPVPSPPSWIPSTVPRLILPPPPSSTSPPPLLTMESLAATTPAPSAIIHDARPTDFSFPIDKTACIVIDMQRDFILQGGFGSTLGNDVKRLQSIVPTVAALLQTCREFGIPLVHTLEAHLSDLSDCPLAKLTRGQLEEGLRIGDKGDMGRILVRHEWGNEIVDENAPLEGEKVIHKPGKGAFCGTDLHEFLIERGITHLLFAGVTTEVCVQTSMREANDRGFECLMLEDCTDSYFPHFKDYTLQMLTAQGAIVGWTGTSTSLREALISAKEAT